MADTSNIADVLESLMSSLNNGENANVGDAHRGVPPDGENANVPPDGENAGNGDFGSFFENIDLDMIMKLGELFALFNRPDKNADLLRALKPHMREENKEKIDTAIKILKVTALLPFLRESGFMDKLF